MKPNKQDAENGRICSQLAADLKEDKVASVEDELTDSEAEDSYYSDEEEADTDAPDDEEMGSEDDDIAASDVENDDDAMDTTVDADEKGKRSFQKSVWTLTKLPYSKELEEQADEHFRIIKAGFGHSVLLNDIRKGTLHYCTELDRYISLHSYRFSKEDHIALLRLLSSFIKKGEIYRDVRVIIRTIHTLLKKRDCLSRSDITFQWRPLYELFHEIAYGSLEEDGVFLMPEGFKDDLVKLIRSTRELWPLEATQEILDEFRPLLCPWDDRMARGMKLLQMFLPTAMTTEEHAQFGAGLWFDEIWHHFQSLQSNSLIESYPVHLFTRLSRDCPGFVDWSGRLNFMFTKIMRSLRLGRGVGLNQSFPMHTAAVWVIYMIGVEKESQSYVSRLLTLVESFLHPSNHGNHTAHVLSALYRLINEMVNRVKRERTGHPLPLIPEHLRLSQEAIETFVAAFLPCLKLAIFTKVKQEFISHIVKGLALLCPRIVIPAILEVVYPALETVTEPHRLTQSLGCLFVALIPMLREEPPPGERSRKAEVVPLLEGLLPAIDPNDIKKTLLCFQVLGVLVNTVPIVDCSDAIHLREDLSEDEKEICSSTANFEGLISGIMDKIFTLLEWGSNGATSCGHGTLAKNSHKFNMEEHVLHDGVRMLFKGIVQNSSLPIYNLAADRLLAFVQNSLYDSHVVASTVSEMVSLVVRARPEVTFSRFLSLISRKLKEAISHETYGEEKVDFTVTWWLSLSCGLFRVHSPAILSHKEEVRELIRLILPIKCTNGISFACKSVQRVLRSLTLCYMDLDREAMEKLDAPLDQHLPIRTWATRLDRKSFNVERRWFVPTTESIAFAKELVDEFLCASLDALATPSTLSKAELYRHAIVVLTFVQGASFSLPSFDTPIIRTNSMPTFIEVNTVVTKPAGTPELTLPSGTLRGVVLTAMDSLISYLLSERESEVKTLAIVISILSTLVFSKGTDRSKLSSIISTHRIARIMMGDRLHGASGYVKALAEESINARVQLITSYHLTEQHKRVIQLLTRISLSSYAENRRTAQSVLSRVLREFPYSFILVIDDILNALNPANDIAHSHLKGALYMLIDGRRLSLLLRQNWEIAAKTWPALIEMRHSERPSIIKLLDTASSTIVDSFESYRIHELTPEPEVIARAEELLAVGADGRHAAKYGQPSQQQRDDAGIYIRTQNEKNQKSYDALVQSLLQSASNTSLHWRANDLSQVFLSMLIRRDVPIDNDCVRLFLRLAVHDTLKTRKMATAFLGAWLKINKPLAIKQPFLPQFVEENRGPGAKWPIKYGFTSDNVCMQYDEAKAPSTAAEWDAFPYVGKMHWAFYTWPRELKTYAPISQQAAVNRSFEDLCETEQLIVNTMKDPEYAKKFRTFMSIEEKKGDDKFNVVTYSYFLGLFRSYNDMLLPVFKEHLEALVAENEEGATRLATEMVSAIVNGSKLWYGVKVAALWEWLSPFLTRVLANLKDNAQRNWGTAVAAMCGSAESRRLRPLIDLLFDLVQRQTDNCYMTAARLFLLQSALCQFEWRSMQLLHKLLPYLSNLIANPYHNIRERIGSTLVTMTWFDLPALHVDHSLATEFTPIKLDYFFDVFDSQLSEVWDEVNRAETEGLSSAASSSASLSTLPTAIAVNDESKKTSKLALKSLVQFLYNYGLQTLTEVNMRVLGYMPLVAHFSFDVGDDELRAACESCKREFLSTVFIPERKTEGIIEMFETFLSRRYSWKVRIVLVSELSSLVFANIFAFDRYKERVAKIVAHQMADDRIEVREAAAAAISLFVHSHYLPVTPQFIVSLPPPPPPLVVQAEFESVVSSESATLRHSGVLGLCSIVQAFPYSVPSFMPDILAFLCRHGREREPIKDTIKRTLGEFKRTHQDCWHEHKEAFTEDQIIQLTDFLVSPNYYV